MAREKQTVVRRNEILTKSLDIFISKGYAATKISDIASAVNMSTGQMFHYFPSKEYGNDNMGDLGNRFKNSLVQKLMDEKYMDKKLKQCYDDRAEYPSFSAFHMAFSVDADTFNESLVFFDCEPYTIAGKTYTRTSLKNYAYEPSFAPIGKIVIQVSVPQFDEDFTFRVAAEHATQIFADSLRLLHNYYSISTKTLSSLSCQSY